MDQPSIAKRRLRRSRLELTEPKLRAKLAGNCACPLPISLSRRQAHFQILVIQTRINLFRVSVASLIVALVHSATVAQDSDAGVSNTIDEFNIRIDGTSLALPVKLKDNTFLFAVDTGCEALIVDKSLRDSLGRPDAVTTLPGGTLTVERFAGLDGYVGNQRLRPAGMSVCMDLRELRDTDGAEIRGILGMSFLRRYIVRLDPEKRKLSLLKSVTEEKSTQIPMSKPHRRPAIMAEIARYGRVELLIDTGCVGHGTISVPRSIFASLEREGAIEPFAIGTSSGLTQQPVNSTFGRVRELKVGDLKEFDVVCSSDDEGEPSLLGLNFLMRHIVTFDFPRGVMYIKAANLSKRFSDSDLSGLNLEWRDGHVTVEEVEVNSPAARAGLMAGDVLSKVNGRDCEILGMAGVIRALCEYGGSVRVELLRNGGQNSLLINLPDLDKPDGGETKTADQGRIKGLE